MAVKAYIASGALDPSNPKQNPLPAEETQGHVKLLVSTAEIANGDSATSTVKFGAIPSCARLLANARLDYDALTGVTALDLGIGKTTSGVLTVQSDNCLVDSLDVHLAGNHSAVSNVDIANLYEPAWKIAGYADDPGGNVDIVGTLDQAATAAGTLTLTLLFATP